MSGYFPYEGKGGDWRPHLPPAPRSYGERNGGGMRGDVPYKGRGGGPLLPLVAHFRFPICYSTRSSSVFAQR